MIVQRYLCLAVPLLAVLGALRFERGRRARTGAFLAFLAAATGIAGLHEVAAAAGWHAFAAVDGAYRGLPIDLWLGWALLWGPLPVLLRRAAPLPIALGLLLWVDVVAMPALDPLVRLGPAWLTGEALGLAAVAVPAQLLGRWTADGRRLGARVLLQMAVFAGLALWLVPSVAFTIGDGGWDRLLRLPAPALVVLAQVALVVALPAVAAVREFAVRGGGTPFPWDPPPRLVTTGPYAYLANPMQLSAVLLMLLLAAATRSATLAAGAVVAAAFSAAVAGPHERGDMRTRHGAQWIRYRRSVRDWVPRRRPYGHGPRARLWLDDDCGACGTVAAALARREPVGLELVPARLSPVRLWRARYEAEDGHRASGVAAVAAALGHGGLLWAYGGWFLHLPGVGWLAQLVTDALIAAPHPAGGAHPAGAPHPAGGAQSTGTPHPTGAARPAGAAHQVGARTAARPAGRKARASDGGPHPAGAAAGAAGKIGGGATGGGQR